MAMYRRPRPGSVRHPPSLAPTVSTFKPRAQWKSVASSIFLYVNLPGFYRDQIEVKKDETTRTIQIQGQRPLSTQIKARFNETYRVPDSCDINNMNISFSHGLLTIEFPLVLAADKQDKTVQHQDKIVERPGQKETGENGSSLGRKKDPEEDKTSPKAKEEEIKTYTSVVEGKKGKATGKMNEGEPSPSLFRKDENIEAAQMGTEKEKDEEKETKRSSAIDGNLKPKVSGKEEKVIVRKNDTDQRKTGQKGKEKEITRTPTIDASLEPKGDVKTEKEEVVEKKKDGEIGSNGDEVRRAEKESAATKQGEAELKMKERDEKQKKVEEAGFTKEKEDVNVKDNAEVPEPRKADQGDSRMEESARDGEGTERMIRKGLETETSPLLVRERQETDMDRPAVGGNEEIVKRGRDMDNEERQKYDLPLVNVGVAALVIMGFGAYVFLPLLKLFY